MHPSSALGRRSLAASALAAVAITVPTVSASTASAHSPEASAAASKRCGSFVESSLRYTVSRSGPVRCAFALRIVKSFVGSHSAWRRVSIDGTVAGTHYTNRRYRGWKCFEGSGGGGCTKGRRSVGYQNAAA